MMMLMDLIGLRYNSNERVDGRLKQAPKLLPVFCEEATAAVIAVSNNDTAAARRNMGRFSVVGSSK